MLKYYLDKTGKVIKSILFPSSEFVDTEPREGSMNPVTSGGVAGSVAQQSSNIAPEYTKTTYPANSYVMQDGVLYTNPNAIGTAEDWNPAHWMQTTIPEIIDDKIDEVTLDPSAVALGNVHLLDEVTSFAADAKILVDSETNGPGAMPKDTLLGIIEKNGFELEQVDVRKLSLGNINITGSGWTWWDEVAGNTNAIARVNKDVELNLSEGDEISLTDFVNYKLNVGYTLDSGTTYLYSGYKNQKFICPGNGRYVFDVSSNDGTTKHSIYEFADVIRIKSKNHTAISKSILDEDEEKKLEYLGFGNVHKFKITGTGNTWIYHRVKVAPNSTLRIKCDNPGWACTSVSSGKVLQLASFNNGGTSYETLGFYPETGAPAVFDHLAQSDTYYIRFAVKADVGVVVNFSVECIENRLHVTVGNKYVRSINHRGYNPIAPENTLPAFRMSAKLGFNAVETDVQKTSDGYYVCIHDSTVNRTSNGSGNVADMTLEQLKALDFGSWRNARYAGTKIPTFDEFLACCRSLGLHPYVELKDGFDELEKVAASVKAYGFEKDITFISSLLSALTQMKTLCPYARLGHILTTISEGDLDNIAGLKNGTNEAFLDFYNVNMTDSVAEDCIAAGIGLELWTCDTTSEIVGSNGYVTGFTSNFIVAEQVLFDKESG